MSNPGMMTGRPLSRRAVLAAAGGGLLAGGARETGAPGLRDIAAARGLVFGSELRREVLQQAPEMAALFVHDCGAMVPGHEAKWDYVEPKQGEFHFTDLDFLVNFAELHHLQIRLHTLLWSEALPDWVKQALEAGQGAPILARHIAKLVGRYRGRAQCWDVANEIADPRWHGGPEGLTMTPWRRALGPGYVAEAFHLAHDADPDAILFINDDDLEHDTATGAAKRATYLRLVTAWKRQGVPINGFGLQGHLKPELPFNPPAWRAFLRELAALGLELHVTELDVVDRHLPADPALRDRLAAELVRQFLDVTLDEKAVSMVMCWGLSDRFSWHDEDPDFRRADGRPARPLPYDASFHPKPMYQAVAAALAAAPVRN